MMKSGLATAVCETCYEEEGYVLRGLKKDCVYCPTEKLNCLKCKAATDSDTVECIACASRFYVDKGACVACVTNCINCAGSTTGVCTQCDINYRLDKTKPEAPTCS